MCKKNKRDSKFWAHLLTWERRYLFCYECRAKKITGSQTTNRFKKFHFAVWCSATESQRNRWWARLFKMSVCGLHLFEIVRTMNNPLTWSPLISPKESWKRTSSPSRKDKIPKIHPRHKPSNIILLVRMPYLRKKRVSGIFWVIFNWMSKSK